MEERTESATREGMRVRRRAGKERRVKRACTYKNYTIESSERVIVYSKVHKRSARACEVALPFLVPCS